LVTGSTDKRVKVWDVETRRCLRTIEVSMGVKSIALSQDERILAVSDSTTPIRLWDFGTGQPVGELEGLSSFVVMLEISPDGRLLAASSHDQPVMVWDLASRQRIATLGRRHVGFGLAFSPDSRRVAASNWDRLIEVWDIASQRQVLT